MLHERMITPLGAKTAPALRVAPEKAPLGVARRSFGITKPLSSRLDWRFFRHNRAYWISVNRPYNETLKREIPEGWGDGTLDALGEIVGGSTPSTKNPENFAMCGTPWITPNDLSNNVGNKFISRGGQDITDVGVKSASLKIYPKNTVLMSSRAPIGYMAIARNELTTNQGFKSFVPTKGYSSEFVFYTVKNAMKAIIQYSSGSTFKEVSGGGLKTVKICLPATEVANSYAEAVKDVFEKQNILELESEKLAELRDWLLPMLMNGQVTVKGS